MLGSHPLFAKMTAVCLCSSRFTQIPTFHKSCTKEEPSACMENTIQIIKTNNYSGLACAAQSLGSGMVINFSLKDVGGIACPLPLSCTASLLLDCMYQCWLQARCPSSMLISFPNFCASVLIPITVRHFAHPSTCPGPAPAPSCVPAL